MHGFSVIMPTYKREHTINRAIDSILAQTHQDWELILIDNFGSDYSFNDERIKVYDYTQLTGAAAARNYGITLATKDLICFLDDDDIFFETYMEKFNFVFRDPKVMIARCRMIQNGMHRLECATIQVVMRTKYATPTWLPKHPRQDQIYFTGIMDENKWTWNGSMARLVNEPLCQAFHHPEGGSRSPTSSL